MHSMRHILTVAALLSSAPLALRRAGDRRQLPPARPPGRLARALLPLGHEGRRAAVARQRLRSLAPGCRDLKALRDKYEPQGVEFLLIDSNLPDTSARRSSRKRRKQGIDMPILIDDTQLIGESLGLARNGEVLVVESAGLEARVSRRRRRTSTRGAASRCVADAQPVKTATSAVARLRDRDAGARQEPGAREDLVLEDDRADADRQLRRLPSPGRHRPVADDELRHGQGLRADDPRSRAHAAHAAVACRPALQRVHERSRSVEGRGQDARALDRGRRAARHRRRSAARAEEGLAGVAARRARPDRRDAGVHVPATGTIPYQMPRVENPLDHDVWVRAVDFLPGERSVLHHIIASARRRRASRRGSLGGYVPGAGPLVLPPETGILLPAKREVLLPDALHRERQGAHRRDRMGLYFRKDAPKYQFRSVVFANPKLKIPANTKAHTESARARSMAT